MRILGFLAVMFYSQFIQAETTPLAFSSIPIKKEDFSNININIAEKILEQRKLLIEKERVLSKMSPSLQSQATYDRLSENDRFPITSQNPSERFLSGASWSHDFDLYKKRSEKIKRSSLLSEKQAADIQVIKDTLYFSAITAYIEASSLVGRISSLRRSIDIYAELLLVTEKQVAVGIKTHEDVVRIQNEILFIKGELNQSLVRMENLGLEIETTYGKVVSVSEIQKLDFDIPRDLFSSPPVVVKKALIDVEVAVVEKIIHEKSLHPDIYFNIDFSLSSLILGSLINPASIAFSVGPSIRYQKPADYEVMKNYYVASFDEFKLTYDKAWIEIRNRFNELLVSLKDIRSNEAIILEQLALADKTLRIAQMKFDIGAADYAEVLQAMIAKQKIERSAMDLDFRWNLLIKNIHQVSS